MIKTGIESTGYFGAFDFVEGLKRQKNTVTTVLITKICLLIAMLLSILVTKNTTTI